MAEWYFRKAIGASQQSVKGGSMTQEQLIAIMAAIIYAGGDDNQAAAAYSPEQAVKRARAILIETETPFQAEAK